MTIVLPDQPPTLQEATRWIAIKGGFQGRQADGHPGVEVLRHGLQKLDVASDRRPMSSGSVGGAGRCPPRVRDNTPPPGEAKRPPVRPLEGITGLCIGI